MTAFAPAVAYGDPLCRFYTRPRVGQVLTDLLGPPGDATRIMDLASGGGALAAAASRKWKTSDLVTVDVDPEVGSKRLDFRTHTHVVADALDADLPDLLGGGEFDVSLCNPPYRMPRWRPGFERILDEAGLAGAVTPATASAEVLFIAQNLRLSRMGGRIGLLVPDGLVSGRRTERFRSALLRHHRIESVVQLPRGAFHGADVKAFIMVLEKGRGTIAPVALRCLDRAGVLGERCLVSPSAAEERMDYDFHVASGRGGGPALGGPALGDLGVAIVRGSIERPRACGLPVFHTPDFPIDGARRAHDLLTASNAGSTSLIRAEPGDVLVARVDRNLQRKVCGVAAGSSVISASVFRLRIPPLHRDAVLDALLSPGGAARLAATARGVGARMIGKEDLLRMRLPV